MDFYSYMLELLPPIYKTKNTLARYKVISKEFNKLASKIKELPHRFVIDKCSNEDLLVLGSNVNVAKIDKDSWDIYRQLIRINYYKLFNVPTHKNIVSIATKVSGFSPILRPLWDDGPDLTNDQGYYIAYDLPGDYHNKVLIELESFIGAGIKIRRDFFYKLEGVTIYPAMYMFDNDQLNIECEVFSPVQKLNMKIDNYFNETLLQNEILSIK